MTTPNKTFHEKLVEIQKAVKVTKDNRNDFGKYNYRKAEDILAEAKPACNALGLLISLSDSVELIGDRFYIVAEAMISDGTSKVSTKAYAREDEKQSGMAAPQVTGSSSSYARKYALSGLLGLDDEKDADSTNDHGKEHHKEQPRRDLRDIKEAGGTQMTNAAHWKAIEELAKKKGVQKPFVKFVHEFEIEMARLHKLPDIK